VIHDRDTTFSGAFDEVFRSEGINVIHTPIRAPQANAYAERFVRTVRADGLDWLLIIGRRHLESVLRIYTAHYNRERPHRGLALLSPDSTNAVPRPSAGEIKRRDRLGGLTPSERGSLPSEIGSKSPRDRATGDSSGHGFRRWHFVRVAREAIVEHRFSPMRSHVRPVTKQPSACHARRAMREPFHREPAPVGVPPALSLAAGPGSVGWSPVDRHRRGDDRPIETLGRSLRPSASTSRE
jgi:hypothetical protein